MTAIIERIKSTIQSEPKVDAVIERMDKLEAERKRAEESPKRRMFH